MIDANGWLLTEGPCSIRHIPSPNYNARPNVDDISLLVVHNISLPPGQFGQGYIEQFFCNNLPVTEHPYFEEVGHLQVSAHALIDRKGDVIQFVSFLDRAWHAGQSCFDGRENCNDFSVGVELEGTDDKPYTDEQYLTLSWLTRELFEFSPGLTRATIVGHEDIAPGRKTDPGPCFDWDRFRQTL